MCKSNALYWTDVQPLMLFENPKLVWNNKKTCLLDVPNQWYYPGLLIYSKKIYGILKTYLENSIKNRTVF